MKSHYTYEILMILKPDGKKRGVGGDRVGEGKKAYLNTEGKSTSHCPK